MNETEAIRAALEELGRSATTEEVRDWCCRQGVTISERFNEYCATLRYALRAIELEASHQTLMEELARQNAELETRRVKRGVRDRSGVVVGD